MDLFAYLLSKKSKPGETITGEGTSIALENTSANQSISMSLAPSELSQSGTPSPSDPQTVHSISGNNTITIANGDGTETQNLPLNLSSIQCIKEQGLSTPKTNSSFWLSVQNEFVPLTDGWGKYEYDNTEGTGYKNINTMIKLSGVNLKPNSQYTIIVELRNVNSQTNASLWLCQGRTDEALSTSKSITINSSTSLITKYLDTTKATFENISIGLRSYTSIAPGNYCSFEARFSIVEGNYTNTDYTYMNYWNPLEYCKIGDYSDEFYLANSSDTTLEKGKWYLKKNIGKVILNGSEALYFNGSVSTPTDRSVFRVPFTYNFLATDYLSDRFIKNSETSNRIVPVLNDSTPYISVEDTILGITSGDTSSQKETKFKTWLASNNVIVYYPISSTYTLLDDTLQNDLNNIYNNGLSYEGETNISQTNADLPFIISATTSSKSEFKIDLLNYILLEDD